MIVDWTRPALEDLTAIVAHIAPDDPAAAHRLVDEIITGTETVLSAQPNAGRPGRVADTREWVAHHNYVVAYRVHTNLVQVLAVVHSARLWPDSL